MKRHAYIVQWEDSCTLGGWQRQDGNHCVSRITTIGWLVRESKKEMTLTTSMSHDSGSVMDALTIPRCAIVKSKKLKHFLGGE